MALYDILANYGSNSKSRRILEEEEDEEDGVSEDDEGNQNRDESVWGGNKQEKTAADR